MHPMSPTDLLVRYLAKRRWSAADLAKASGLSPSFLSRLLRGQRDVGARAAVALEAVTHIPLKSLLSR